MLCESLHAAKVAHLDRVKGILNKEHFKCSYLPVDGALFKLVSAYKRTITQSTAPDHSLI